MSLKSQFRNITWLPNRFRVPSKCLMNCTDHMPRIEEEPVQTEVVQTEPVQTEAVQTEPVQTEAVQTEAGITEAEQCEDTEGQVKEVMVQGQKEAQPSSSELDSSE